MKKIRILPWILALLFLIAAHHCEKEFNAEKERRALETENSIEADSLTLEHKKSPAK